jgi:16S rRNA (adenine1518-N6/adenine1519-N6)-dimethyltransferase
MSLLQETQDLARLYRLRPDTDRGQNFLIDEGVVADSLRAGGIKAEDTVLEIGCGLGTLTTALARRVTRVVGIESDRRLFGLLDKLKTDYDNLTLIKNDFLKIEPDELYRTMGLKKGHGYKVVANIPYYITGKIISQLFSLEQLPTTVVLLVQKEVAEKIVAQAGDHSKQSLGVQFYGQPKIARLVSRRAFWPAPAVDSALLVIEKLHHWDYKASEEEVWQLIRLGFSSRRKTLLNNLSTGLKLTKPEVEEWLVACALSPKIRAQDLDLQQWVELTKKSKVKGQN